MQAALAKAGAHGALNGTAVKAARGPTVASPFNLWLADREVQGLGRVQFAGRKIPADEKSRQARASMLDVCALEPRTRATMPASWSSSATTQLLPAQSDLLLIDVNVKGMYPIYRKFSMYTLFIQLN
jgi:hypothetical protein